MHALLLLLVVRIYQFLFGNPESRTDSQLSVPCSMNIIEELERADSLSLSLLTPQTLPAILNFFPTSWMRREQASYIRHGQPMAAGLLILHPQTSHTRKQSSIEKSKASICSYRL
jgi:hypothetical protein